MPQQDPYAEFQQPAQGSNPYAAFGAPASSPPDTRNSIQKSFDTNTETNPNEPLLKTGLKSVVGAIGSNFVHPLEAAKGLSHIMEQSPENPLVQAALGAGQDYKAGGLPYAATKAA